LKRKQGWKVRTGHQLNFSVPPVLLRDQALREGDQPRNRTRFLVQPKADLHGARTGPVHERDLTLAEKLEDANAGSGGAGIDDDAKERYWRLRVNEFGGEEVEEERDGEERGEEDEPFGLECLLVLSIRVC
jgi:hypothetical protein